MLYASALAVHSSAMGMALLLIAAREPLLFLGWPGPVKIALHVARVGSLLMAVGVLAGITLVVAGGWHLLTPWLMLSFVLIVAMAVIDSKLVGPWEARVRTVLKGDAQPLLIKKVAGDKGALAARLWVIVLFALVAGLMMRKPEIISSL